MSQPVYLLGYDVGGTKIVVSLGTSDGKILGTQRIENKDTYPDVILPLMVETSKKLVSEAGIQLSDIRAFGISTPGPADIPNGIMTAPTNNKHWRNVPSKSISKTISMQKASSKTMQTAVRWQNGSTAQAKAAMTFFISP